MDEGMDWCIDRGTQLSPQLALDKTGQAQTASTSEPIETGIAITTLENGIVLLSILSSISTITLTGLLQDKKPVLQSPKVLICVGAVQANVESPSKALQTVGCG